MKNWKLDSKNKNIARLVQCYWFIQKEPDDTGHDFPKLNPDPSGTLILAPLEQPYSYKNNESTFTGSSDHWIFPNSRTLQLDHSKPFTIVGIKFHVGALYALDIKPKQPVIDQIEGVNISSLVEATNSSKLDLIEQAQTAPNKCVESLDELFEPWLSGIQLDKHSELCRRALDLLSATPVSKIGDLLHCSQRTVERSFLRTTGFTLKQCQSMNNFELMLEKLYSVDDSSINWSDIVEEFGFSDQPHLIRYIKNMIGATPNEYLKTRDLTIDTYGNFEQL